MPVVHTGSFIREYGWPNIGRSKAMNRTQPTLNEDMIMKYEDMNDIAYM